MDFSRERIDRLLLAHQAEDSVRNTEILQPEATEFERQILFESLFTRYDAYSGVVFDISKN